MSLFRRLFYRKTPDRLLEITDSVYVFDCCFSSETMKEEEYTDYLDDIVLQLQNYLPEAAFMVFNFRESEEKSLISDILFKYDITVINYPQHYVGCPVLPIEVVHRFLSDCNNWLSMGGQKNVLLMHCERGGWPLLAFMLASVLLYRKQYSEEKRTLELVCAQASKKLFHLYSLLDPRSSHLRYLNYISRERVALDIPYNLTCLVLNTVPNFDGQGGCRPVVRVYGEDPFMPIDKTPKLLFTTSVTQEIVWYFREADISAVILDINCCVHGDVVLECIHMDENLEHEEIMFRVVFNTAFIQSYILPLDHEQIDVSWSKKGQFSEKFKAEVHFSDFDTASDPSTEPLIEDEDDHEAELDHDDDGDESGFGSAEEFFEAEEIFSNSEIGDGLDNHEAELDLSSSEIEAKSSFELNSSKYDNNYNTVSSTQQLATMTNTTLMPEILTENVKFFDANKLEYDISGERSRTSDDIVIDASVVGDHSNSPEEINLIKEGFDNTTNALSVSTSYAETVVENTTSSTLSGSLNSVSNAAPPPAPPPLPTYLHGRSSSKASPLPLSPPSVRPPPQPPPTPQVQLPTQLKLDHRAHISILHTPPPPPPPPSLHLALGTSFLTKSSRVPSPPYIVVCDGAPSPPPPPPQYFQGYVEVPPSPPLPLGGNGGAPTPPSLEVCDEASPPPPSKVLVGIPQPPSLFPTQSSIINVPSLPSEEAKSIEAPLPPFKHPHTSLVEVLASPPPPPPLPPNGSSRNPSSSPQQILHRGYIGASPQSSVVCDGVLSLPPPPPPPFQRHVKVPSPSPPPPKVLGVASPPTSLEVCDGASPTLPSKLPGGAPPPPPPPPPEIHGRVPKLLNLERAGGIPHPPLLPSTNLDGPSPKPLPPPPFGRPGGVPSSRPPTPPGRLDGALYPPPPPEKPGVAPSTPPPPPPPPPPKNHGVAPSTPPPPPPSERSSVAPSPPPPPAERPAVAPSPPPPPPERPGGAPSPSPLPGRSGGAPSPPPPPGRPGVAPSPSLPPGRPDGAPSPPPPPPPPPPPLGTADEAPSPPPPPLALGKSGVAPSPPPPPPGRSGGGPPPPPPPPGRFGGGPPPPPPPPGTFSGGPPPPPPPGRPGGGPPPPPPPGRPGGGPSPPPPPMPGGHPGGPPAPPRAPGAPPPPGLSGGSSNALKGPGSTQSPAFGRSAANSQKATLKPLHWVKVSRAMQGSLWAEFQKQTDKQSHPEFDVSELVSLFSVAVKKPASSKTDDQSKSISKSNKVTLVDLRRANNTAIMLTKVKMPLPDMMSAVLALDESQLDADQVENLIKFCPTKEEMELLKGYTGDKENLGPCEQFFLELMKVPRVESKLKSFLFKIQFRAQIADLRKNLVIVNSASEEIRNSDKLKEIMKRILFLGNTLNQGTARGSAVGFRLDSLLKLVDIRATNNKMTLMHYLCKVLASKSPHLLQFHADLISLEAASKIQLKSLAEEQQTIVKGLEKVELELSASERDGPVSDVFRQNLKEFIDSAKAEGQSITALYSMAGKNADMVSIYFGEDPAKCPFEQVTATLLNFIRMFKKANDENCKEAELEKKKAQKESEMEKSKEGCASKKTSR